MTVDVIVYMLVLDKLNSYIETVEIGWYIGRRCQEDRRRILLVALLLLNAITFAGIFKPDELRIFPETQEKLGFLACPLVFILIGATHIPTIPVVLLVVAWKGPIKATILAGLRNTIADFIEYYSGGSIGDLTDIENKRERLPFHLGRLPYNSPAFLFFARLVPIIGPMF